MADSTINYGLPFPTGGDAVVVHTDIKKLAENVDASLFQTDQRVNTAIPYRGFLDEQTGTLATLEQGRYEVRYLSSAVTFGIPQQLLGQLEIVDTDTQRQIAFRPNDAGAGLGSKLEWFIATDSDGVLRDRWSQLDKSIMTTAPVVLSAPAGDYPQTETRGAVRIPFTVPCTIGKVRVHMRPWNFRTRQEWGPARLDGVMIAQQSSFGSGTITGNRWYAPNAAGAIVDGSTGWTSDWFHANLSEGSTFLLSYSAEWLDTTRNLVQSWCWSSFDRTKWDSAEDAIFQNGWGSFGLQPMDIWIEVEAPSTVETWGYIGSSNEVFAQGQAFFSAYPAVHARKNKVFAAITAAGGWSPMDETFHDPAIIGRFGHPARMLDRLYMSMGANIDIRGATSADAIVEMERWLNVRLPALGNPPVHMLTQVSAPTIADTGDTYGTLSDWNQWVRFEAMKRNDVAALHDQAVMFADPKKPWTALAELRESPTDVHFSVMGQKLRAQALDGEIALPTLTARNASEMGPAITYMGDGVYEIA